MTYGTQTYGTTTYGGGSGSTVLVPHPTMWRIAAGNPGMQAFDPFAPGEIHVCAFDLTADITPGDYLVGTPQISITLASGSDTGLAGFVELEAQLSGNLILVEATAAQIGAWCNYYFAAACLTALGQVLSLGGRVSVIPAALQ